MGLRIAISAVALVMAAVHLLRPELRIDSITLILLVIGAIPWTQPLIRSIELLGVKLELQELQNKVAEARGAAESASRQAGLALSVSTASPSSEVSGATESNQSDQIRSLANEYERIRATQRSGDARTAAMTDVVRRMIEVARRTESVDVASALNSDSRGMRLFAYAYLFARPDPQVLPALVDSVTVKEDKPFGQYWGLQAIGRVMAGVDPAPPEVRMKLHALSAKLPPGTDRDHALRGLLQQVG